MENSAEVAAALQARYGSHARVTLVECCSQNKLTVHEQVLCCVLGTASRRRCRSIRRAANRVPPPHQCAVADRSFS